MSVTCQNSHLPVSAQLQTLLRTDSATKINGLAATKTTFDPLTMVPAINCGNNDLSFVDLLLLCIGVDACGKPSLRYTTIQSCDLVKNCDNAPFDFLNTVFVKDTTSGLYYIVLVEAGL